MANVQFLKGSSQNLPVNNSIEGAFYLTSDTYDLYYGTGAAPVKVNETVVVKDNWAAVQAETTVRDNVIYYAADENILCIKKNGTWHQINPDTDTDTYVSGLSISEGVKDETTGDVTFTITLNQSDKDNNPLNAIQQVATFTLTSEMISELAGASVGLEGTFEAKKITIKTEGDGSNTTDAGVVINLGDNLAYDNGKLVATDTTYALSNNGAKVELKTADNAPAGSVEFKAGAKLNVASANGNITYSHLAPVAAEDDTAVIPAINNSNIHGQVITIPEIAVDAYGHVTKAAPKTVTVETHTYSGAPIEALENGGLQYKVVDENGTGAYAVSNGILYNTITVDGKSEKVWNQGDLGSFYSAATIDQKMAGLNAFTYKGTIEPSVTGVDFGTDVFSIGDTYKAKASGTYKLSADKTVDLHIGDIVIANGTEDVDGIITSGLTWDVIHAEEDTDTTYTLEVANNTATLVDSVNNGKSEFVTIEGGDELTASTEGRVITINHDKKSGLSTELKGANSANVDYKGSIVVPKIQVNEYGHVTAIDETAVTLPERQEFALNAANNKVTLSESGMAGTIGSVEFAGDDYITATLTNGANSKLTVSHITYNPQNDVLGVEGGTVDYGQTLTAVTGVERDQAGHVKGITTTNFKLPAKVEYALSGATFTALTSGQATGFTVTSTLKDGDDHAAGTSKFGLMSETLQMTQSNGNIKVDLVWGTFGA